MKKAYIIPLVILLLFVSVVPCFAVDDSAYINQLYNGVARPYAGTPITIVFEADHLDFSYNSSTTVSYTAITFPDIFKSLQVGHTYFLSCYLTLSQTHYVNFAIYKNGSTLFQSFGTNLTADIESHYTRQFTVSDEMQAGGLFNFYPQIFDGSSYSGSIRALNLFDITGISQNDYIALLEHLDLDFRDHTIPSGYYFKPGIFSPFLSFYTNIAHSFDFVNTSNSYFMISLAFVSGIIAVLVFIFLVVFMIKRFTGGKC